MRIPIILALLIAFVPSVGSAGPTGRMHFPRGAAGENPGSFSVAVVQLPGGATVSSLADAAVAELGTVSSNVRSTATGVEIIRRSQSYVVVTTIGLRASAVGFSGAVGLQAFLDEPVGGLVVRVDGVALTSIPQVVARRVQTGIVTRHRIELEIPNAMSPASVPAEIPLEFGAIAQ